MACLEEGVNPSFLRPKKCLSVIFRFPSFVRLHRRGRKRRNERWVLPISETKEPQDKWPEKKEKAGPAAGRSAGTLGPDVSSP